MTEHIAKITSTFLGVQDHGILTATAVVDYGGSGQSIGGYCLDAPRGERRGRVGTAFGMEWVARFIRACGVDSWEKVTGRTVIVVKADGDYSKVLGIKPLPTENGKPFIFAELADEFFPEKASA